MNEKQARALLLYTVVVMKDEPDVMGTVVFLGSRFFKVNWGDGESSLIPYTHADWLSIK